MSVTYTESVAERLSARVMCLVREHAQTSRATGCEARGWNVNRGATMDSTEIHVFSLRNRVMVVQCQDTQEEDLPRGVFTFDQSGRESVDEKR